MREEPGGATLERTLYVGIALVFALLLGIYLVYKIAVVVLVLLLTILFSIIVSAPVDYLSNRGLGRGRATFAVLGGLVLFSSIVGVVLAPAVENQARELAAAFPALLENAQRLVERLQSALGIETPFGLDPEGLLGAARRFLTGGTLMTVASVGASVAAVLSFGVVTLIAVVYTVARPTPLVNGFVALFPAGYRQRVRVILGEMYQAVQRWFLGQLASMTIIGVLSTVALSVIGIPFALLLGIFSGLISFVPFVGPVISVIPPVLLALTGDPLDAAWVILAYIGIQAIESNLIQPLVMSRAVSLHPAVIVFALLIMGTLFGFVGVFLAIPLLAALHVLLQELWIGRMDSLGTDPNPPEEGAPYEPKRRASRLRRAARGLFRS
ncbi:MAG TPA: AI-2E family transporter [Rubrobacteraceae bacterium]|nr:AI-2E family transporter [Rubrobacteraceae bacterium]